MIFGTPWSQRNGSVALPAANQRLVTLAEWGHRTKAKFTTLNANKCGTSGCRFSSGPFERFVEGNFANLRCVVASRTINPAAIWSRAFRSLSGVMTGRLPPMLP